MALFYLSFSPRTPNDLVAESLSRDLSSMEFVLASSEHRTVVISVVTDNSLSKPDLIATLEGEEEEGLVRVVQMKEAQGIRAKVRLTSVSSSTTSNTESARQPPALERKIFHTIPLLRKDRQPFFLLQTTLFGLLISAGFAFSRPQQPRSRLILIASGSVLFVLLPSLDLVKADSLALNNKKTIEIQLSLPSGWTVEGASTLPYRFELKDTTVLQLHSVTFPSLSSSFQRVSEREEKTSVCLCFVY
jgi:hypothetical protein